MNYKGSRSALDEHYQSIEECFEKDPPHTLAEAVARIEKLTGIKKSVKAVREFLKRLGWKCRKVGTIPAKVDAKKQREFLNTVLRPRLDEACKGLREILFMDAAHFVHGSFLGNLWSKVRIFIRTPSGRKRFNVLGAVNAITKKLHTYCNTTYINSECVCEFLRAIAQEYPGKAITIFLDNARYQRCALVLGCAAGLNIDLHSCLLILLT